MNVFEELPLSLTEKPFHVDPQWLLARPFKTKYTLPAAVTESRVTSAVTARNKIEEEKSKKAAELASRTNSWDSLEHSESLAASIALVSDGLSDVEGAGGERRGSLSPPGKSSTRKSINKTAVDKTRKKSIDKVNVVADKGQRKKSIVAGDKNVSRASFVLPVATSSLEVVGGGTTDIEMKSAVDDSMENAVVSASITPSASSVDLESLSSIDPREEARTKLLRKVADFVAETDMKRFVKLVAEIRVLDDDFTNVPQIPDISVDATTVVVTEKPTKGKKSAQNESNTVSIPVEEPKLRMKPAWLADVPAMYLLGEVVVEVRSTTMQGDTSVPFIVDKQSSESEINKESNGSDTLVVTGPAEKVLDEVVETENKNGSLTETLSALLSIKDKVDVVDSSSPPIDVPSIEYELMDSLPQPWWSKVVQAAEKQMNSHSDSPIASPDDDERVPFWLSALSPSPSSVANLVGDLAAVATPPFTRRITLCGASDLSKQSLACEIEEQSKRTIRVIEVERLVQAFVDKGRQQALSPSLVRVDNESDRLAEQLYRLVGSGGTISDEMYVSLVIWSIKILYNQRNTGLKELVRLQEEGKETTSSLVCTASIVGFVLADFPNTRAQAASLVLSLSGIHYEQHKSQRADLASPYVSLMPFEEEKHDVSLCGLDAVVYVESIVRPESDQVLEGVGTIRDVKVQNAWESVKEGSEEVASAVDAENWRTSLIRTANKSYLERNLTIKGGAIDDTEATADAMESDKLSPWPKDPLIEVFCARKNLDTGDITYLMLEDDEEGLGRSGPVTRVSHLEEIRNPRRWVYLCGSRVLVSGRSCLIH